MLRDCSIGFAILYLSAVAVADDTEAPAPLPAEDAPHHMSLPEGFRATLFAGEPHVVQPIALTIDDRGRLWVVECQTYPDWLTGSGATGNDRILIFEDTDGDGRFDHRKVFWDKGTNLTGIALGFGGVWLTATPNLIFLPDQDGDDLPDGPPEVLLDGWDLKARHNVFNGLTWGPDGWLYGCNGILSRSRVGPPGTPDTERVPLDCGVWRYHPLRHEFEVVAWGTTNPWGLDFDDFGQMFITNCVIHHLWHVVPGAHFQRMFGQDLNPHTYQLIESCADHIHWGGGRWQDSRGGEGIHDRPGGGHAHAGCMIYLADNWPGRYRNRLFTCNIHGNRVNQDLLERKGSGYVARHGQDFLMANDTWFRGLELKYGPDGGVYLTDWCDTGECHDYKNTQKQNGRIYKITYADARKSVDVNLAEASNRQLIELQMHSNDWYVRHARRLLQERASAGRLDASTKTELVKMYRAQPDVRHKLRAVWALHVIGALDGALIGELLDSPHEYVRGWAVQLELEDGKLSPERLERLVAMAESDPSAVMRLYLASGLQRLPAEERWPLAEALVGHAEDADDAYLPLMIWYGVEPLIPADTKRALRLLLKTKIPLVRQLVTRRIASMAE